MHILFYESTPITLCNDSFIHSERCTICKSFKYNNCFWRVTCCYIYAIPFNPFSIESNIFILQSITPTNSYAGYELYEIR